MEFLCQIIWIAVHKNSSNGMSEMGHLAKVMLAIKRNGNVKSFRA